MRIIFVGIHNKPNTAALDSKTKSGKLIDRIIDNLRSDICIKTNLFNLDYLPKENLEKYKSLWIKENDPKKEDKIVLLGSRVQKYFPEKISSKLIKIKHPSAIWSKESQEKYIKETLDKINQE